MKQMAKLYGQDGTGRDSYIFFNNGGFYPGQQRLLAQQSETKWGYGSPMNQKTNYKLMKRQFYQSDGTGRDTYVVTNVQNRILFQPEFPTQLRTYQSQVISPRFPYKLPPLHQAKLNTLANNQSKLNESLSIPKFKKQKKSTTKFTLGDEL